MVDPSRMRDATRRVPVFGVPGMTICGLFFDIINLETGVRSWRLGMAEKAVPSHPGRILSDLIRVNPTIEIREVVTD